MPRLFIADSEDEEDDGPPDSPVPVALPPHGLGQSSDPLSRGTDSTDTAFFKSVYYEQAEAVQERTRNEFRGAQPTTSKRMPDGEGMWDVPSSPDMQQSSSRKKRRKFGDDERSSPKRTDEQQPGAGSSMLPPTLQIDNEAAFTITPQTMTKSQREEYQSIDYGSSVDREPLPGLQTHGQRLLDLTSSSSGTNMNTPRTTGALTQTANTQDLPATAPYEDLQDHPPSQTPQNRNSRTRRYSSPDVIAADVTADHDAQYHEPTGDDEDIRAATFTEHEGAELEDQEPIVIEDDESSFEEEPVKPKKKRGRPKKTKVEDAMPVIEPAPTEKTASTEAVKKKKKRGRPRKDEKIPDKATNVAVVDSPVTTRQEDGLEKLKSAKDSGGSSHEDEEQGHRSESHREGTELPLNVIAEKEEEKPEVLVSDQPPLESKALERESCKIDGGKHLQIGGKDENKPVYRVGLSKRTRIAPLLKIIRK